MAGRRERRDGRRPRAVPTPTGTGPVPAGWRGAPGLWVLLGYRRAWASRDVLAGTTVAAYLVPQVLAYAEVAGLPPITGLWAVLLPLAAYALLGSSRVLSVGPESTTALMTGVAVASLTGGDPDEAPATAAALAVGVGLARSGGVGHEDLRRRLLRPLVRCLEASSGASLGVSGDGPRGR